MHANVKPLALYADMRAAHAHHEAIDAISCNSIDGSEVVYQVLELGVKEVFVCHTCLIVHFAPETKAGKAGTRS